MSLVAEYKEIRNKLFGYRRRRHSMSYDPKDHEENQLLKELETMYYALNESDKEVLESENVI
jgi:hypothetical protein